MGVRSTFHAAVRDEWDGLERISRDLRPADFLTMLNALLGLGAILAAKQGHPLVAVYLVLLGVLADGADGQVARRGGGGGPLGGPLDSLADAVTFVAAPVAIGVAVLPQDLMGSGLVLVAPFLFYALCGLLRLARFEAIRSDRQRGYFSGLSTPGAAVVLLALILAGTETAWVLATAPVVGLLMVSRVRYPKLRGALGAAAAVALIAVLATALLPELVVYAAWTLAVFMGIYLLAGPFYVLTQHGPPRIPAEVE